MKAKQTRFIDPYKEINGKLRTNLKTLKHDQEQSGVYLISENETGDIVYVGYSENSLYKTIYRHFQKWVDISRTVKTRFTYEKKGYKVRIIFTTPARAALLEKHLIVKIQPRDNGFKYDNYLFPEQEKEAETILKETIYINNTETPF